MQSFTPMEKYASALNYAIPFFLILLLIEAIAARIQKANVINSMDTLSSLSSGVTNAIKDVLGLTLIIVSYEWLVDKIAILEIETTWLVYLLAFIGLDFAGYWNHRLSHQVNYFWNVHIIHHSSEEFNLACALRQSISTIFSTLTLFLIPTALLGVPGEVIGVIAPLHLFAQYWYHTRLIGKMGFLEKILVTPSHHRVHHAINKEYLDKNMAQIFIVWDKMFGTFQEELDDVPCVYGVKRPVKTWNPVTINFMHLWQLIVDAWRAKSYWDKLRIWFMPTGWRPADVAQAYPINTIEDVHAYQKYQPQVSKSRKVWGWMHFVSSFILMMHMFNNFGAIGFPGVLIYGLFIIMSVYSITTLLDGHPKAWIPELATLTVGFLILTWSRDWFLLENYMGNVTLVIGSLLLFRSSVSFYFNFAESRKLIAA